MRVIQMAAKADPDGILRLTIPVGQAGSEFEVAVVVSLKQTANGIPSPKTAEELGWPPGFFQKTFGSIEDEAFKRYPQGEFEKRESLD
jgi:hypothetical protein